MKGTTVSEEQGKLTQQGTSPIGDIGKLIFLINKKMEAVEAFKGKVDSWMENPQLDIDESVKKVLVDQQEKSQKAIKETGDAVIGQIDEHKKTTIRDIGAKSGEAVTAIDGAKTGALAQITSKSEEAVGALTAEQARLITELRQPMDSALAQLETSLNSALADLAEHLASARGNLGELAADLQQQVEQQKSAVQTLHNETLAAKDVTVRVASEIQKSLDGVVDIRERAEATTAQKEEAVRQAEEAMQRAQASAQEASQIRQAAATEAAQAQGKLIVAAQSEIAKVQEQFDRIVRLERIMSALDGAVKGIYASSTASGSTTTVTPPARVDTPITTTSGTSATQPQPITTTPTAETASVPPTVETQPKTASAPPTVESQPKTAPPTVTTSEPPIVTTSEPPIVTTPEPPIVTTPEPPVALLPRTLMPGTSAFSFLARFTQFVNIQWSDVQAAVERNDTRFFNNRRLQDLDLILYGDIPTLLNASGAPVAEELAAELELARTQYRQQLTQAGMVRIEGKPGDRVTPYWLESDPDKSVPTTDRTLDGTYADIVPGNAGYKLGVQAIRPTIARFYKLTGS